MRVATKINTNTNTYPVGSTLTLPCDVDGYPTPEVYWTKDGAQLNSAGRIHISGNYSSRPVDDIASRFIVYHQLYLCLKISELFEIISLMLDQQNGEMRIKRKKICFFSLLCFSFQMHTG